MRVLALDVGSSSVRAQLHDEHAAGVGEPAQRRYEATAGTLDPDELVAATRAVLAEVGAAETLGCSTFWHSLLALDARGRPLTPVLTWRDVRSAPQAIALRERLDEAAIHRRTGCELHPSYWPAKLAWLREEEPETFERAACFVSFGDYLLRELAGELRTSVSMASGTGLWTDAGWDEELLDELGLAAERLPPVSDEPVGAWLPPRGDGALSNLGAGCVTADRAALMIGTSGALRVLQPDDGRPPRPGLFRYRLDEGHVVDGGSLSDGGNLYAWLARTLRLPGDVDVAGLEPDAHGLTFLPLLGGERSPGWHPDARGAITGLTFETEPVDVLQAALEGVALRFADILDLLPEVREIVATGAALDANPGWVQILADVLERPIRTGPAEGSLRGAALVALERAGAELPPAADGGAVGPRRERGEAYRLARARQRNLYRGVT